MPLRGPGPYTPMLLEEMQHSAPNDSPFQAREDSHECTVLNGDSTSHALLDLIPISWSLHPVPKMAKCRITLRREPASALFLKIQPITFKVGDGKLSVFKRNLFLKTQFKMFSSSTFCRELIFKRNSGSQAYLHLPLPRRI